VSLPKHPSHLIKLSSCLSFVLSASSVTTQLAPVKFSNNKEAREKAHSMVKDKDSRKVCGEGRIDPESKKR
jgi:hypothetical protein